MLTRTVRRFGLEVSLVVILVICLSILWMMGQNSLYAFAAEDEDGKEMVDISQSYDDYEMEDSDYYEEDPADSDGEEDIFSEENDLSEEDSSQDFDAMMEEEAFPEQYEAALSDLHEDHPNWIFRSYHTDYTWEDAMASESKGTRNLISPSAPKSQKSGSKTHDGGWNEASDEAIAYYLDPRNFLTEEGIYQFLLHTYDADSQSPQTVAAIIEGSFMEDADPEGDYETYAETIAAAGEVSGVNPNVLAAMIIQEQGWDGCDLSSGDTKGYEGYYNFYNIGAYTTKDMSAVQRGLWYASGSGEDATSYDRPWDSPYKAILGGADFYNECYVSQNQDSYYTKKFNVKNGIDAVGQHQYMTNVAAAASEGALVRRAYEDNPDLAAVFEIPVYEDMPEDPCALPQ